jgi:hypothetical protein
MSNHRPESRMAFSESISCHPEGALFSDQRVSDAVFEMLCSAQHDMAGVCQAIEKAILKPVSCLSRLKQMFQFA